MTPTPTVTHTPTATGPAPFSSASFVYDGDGRRVKATLNGTETTYFVGNYYEVTGSSVTKYYYAGSQRIAMSQDGTLSFILSDHLGSTSLVTDAAGNVLSELRYTAWGEIRYASSATPIDYTYTGQYSQVEDFGLMFYNARWYDPYITQFSQPDSIIPDPYNPQDWNRYSYARYNPIKYTDPTGHSVDCGLGDRYCSAGEYKPSALLKLYKEEKEDWPIYGYSALTEDIEYYLKRHPEYDPQQDGMVDKFGHTTGMGFDFNYQREKYWAHRAADAGLCSLLFCQGEAWKLMRYYDYHEQFEDAEWVWGNPDVIRLDIIGIPLGLVGKGINVSVQTPYTIIGGASSLTTGINSGYEGDTFGVVLSMIGPIPVYGSLASAVSLGRDVGRWEIFEYVPTLNR